MRKTIAALAVAALSAGCARHAVKKDARAAGQPATEVAGGIEAGRAVEPDLRDQELRSIPQLKAVNFDYDSDRLGAGAGEVLRGNAEWLKQNPAVRVQVSGNCDQRGTVEYNLALGQRRAKTVREYYLHLGVAGGRIATISYGKERPVCRESTEECWQKNRRADTLEAVQQNVSATP